MSLINRILALAQAIGTDIKQVRNDIASKVSEDDLGSAAFHDIGTEGQGVPLLSNQNYWINPQVVEHSGPVTAAFLNPGDGGVAIQLSTGQEPSRRNTVIGTKGEENSGELFIGPDLSLSYRMLHSGNFPATTPVQVRNRASERYVTPDAVREAHLFEDSSLGFAARNITTTQNLALRLTANRTLDFQGHETEHGKVINIVFRSSSSSYRNLSFGASILNGAEYGQQTFEGQERVYIRFMIVPEGALITSLIRYTAPEP